MRRNGKKVLIPIIIGLVVITICIVVLLVLATKKPSTNVEQPQTTPSSEPTPSASDKPEVEIDLSNVDEKYSNIAITFADGLSNTKDMEKFIKDYLDSTAFVAYYKSKGNLEDFYVIYGAVEDEEKTLIEDSFKEMITKNDSFEVIKMTDIKDIDENDHVVYSSDVTFRDSDGKQAVFTFIYYDTEATEESEDDEDSNAEEVEATDEEEYTGPIVIGIMDDKGKPITDNSDALLDYFLEVEEKEEPTKPSEKPDDSDSVINQMSQTEVDIYNAKIKAYINDEAKGIEVKSLIDNVISQNEENVGETGKFIGISTDIEESVTEACSKASMYDSTTGKLANEPGDNTDENVEAAAKAMGTLKSKINAAKTYKISAVQASGVYVWLVIEENE